MHAHFIVDFKCLGAWLGNAAQLFEKSSPYKCQFFSDALCYDSDVLMCLLMLNSTISITCLLQGTGNTNPNIHL